jgi:hypothetical protein
MTRKIVIDVTVAIIAVLIVLAIVGSPTGTRGPTSPTGKPSPTSPTGKRSPSGHSRWYAGQGVIVNTVETANRVPVNLLGPGSEGPFDGAPYAAPATQPDMSGYSLSCTIKFPSITWSVYSDRSFYGATGSAANLCAMLRSE